MSNKTFGLPDNVRDYLVSVSVREPSILKRLREETSRLPLALMQISPEQGQFLALLVQILRPSRCLEVGVFTGYSSLVVALALPAHGQITACDVSEEWTAIARRYWKEAGVDRKIDLHLAPAVQTLDRLIAEGQAGTYDFAFIDADKERYQDYYERALTLVRSGGLIAVDNTLWYGRPADSAVDDPSTLAIREFNRRLFEDPRISITLVPIGDGVTLALKANGGD